MRGDGRPTADTARYTQVAIWLHWTIAALILYNLVGAIGREFVPESIGDVMMYGHKANGIVVLFLSLARLAWRLGHRPPPLPAATPALPATSWRLWWRCMSRRR